MVDTSEYSLNKFIREPFFNIIMTGLRVPQEQVLFQHGRVLINLCSHDNKVNRVNKSRLSLLLLVVNVPWVATKIHVIN